MPTIRVLPPELVNRIAAGECIERPASVVKELVENALDSGADRIDVTIVDGGRELIRVADNGCGMAADDLRMAVMPHATSKIARDEDLFDIHTMGFRGEALPSIGSVARLRLVSRPRAEDAGHALSLEGGAIDGPTPVGCPVGTTVEVRDLFYAVPARRKFLKTNQTEVGHVSEQFTRLALAHPEVAFSLRHGERKMHTLPAGDDPRRRIADLFGPELANVLIPVQRDGHGVSLSGWVCPPRESRASNKWEYVFVNGRYVRDRFVSHAIRSAYRSLIDPARYPVAFLFITIAPDQVDVNVHPTKIEVRWRDSNYIHGQVLAALRDKFLRTALDHNLRAPADAARQEGVRQALVDFFTRGDAGAARPEPSDFIPGRSSRPASGVAYEPRAAEAAPPDALTPCTGDFLPPRPQRALAAEAPLTSERADAARESVAAPIPGRAIQIHNAYIVTQTEDGLMIIDQHALHERVMYERLRARITDRPLESQRLLLPEMVTVAPDRIEALETHADLLARLGLELTPAGPRSVSIQAFPSFLENADRVAFVADLLDRLGESGARPDAEAVLHDALDMMACKAAVKFGDSLTEEEIHALLEQKETALRSSHCPHGRPTTLRLTLRDLERQFHRR